MALSRSLAGCFLIIQIFKQLHICC